MASSLQLTTCSVTPSSVTSPPVSLTMICLLLGDVLGDIMLPLPLRTRRVDGWLLPNPPPMDMRLEPERVGVWPPIDSSRRSRMLSW